MIQSLKEKRYLRINAGINFVEMWRPVKNDEYGFRTMVQHIQDKTFS